MGSKAVGAQASRQSESLAIRAVIFDMDGVVTDTARAHAASWKRMFDAFLRARADASDAPANGDPTHAQADEDLAPFDADADYREYLDGKPRYDGVQSFLRSRGIELPWGTPEDPPERETVCGLGNRKNRYFNDWLERHQVETYGSTLRLVDALRATGIRTAVFTSSRNGRTVLANAGLEDRFDARVDGCDLDTLGIRGKPDPAMLVEAAARVGVEPAEAAVFEDALSGVEAGAAGGFAQVIGLDRDDYGEALAERGADLVVHDVAELAFDPAQGFAVRRMAEVGSVWEREAELREALRSREPVVFLDYDGTLTPIVTDHRKAELDASMREAIDRLAEHCTVAIVSGRDLRDLERRVGLNSVLYAGSHGFDIEAPGRLRKTLKKGESFLPILDEAEQELQRDLSGIEGHSVERKRFAIAVHYRQVAEDEVERLEQVVDDVVAAHPRLRKGRGKKVFQIQPRIDWHKGRAVQWLLHELDLEDDGVLPIYVGDDLTDEDAFRALAGRGLGIVVGDESRATAADLRIARQEEVARLLDFMTNAIDGN